MIDDLIQLSAILNLSGRGLTYLAHHTAVHVRKSVIMTGPDHTKRRVIFAPDHVLRQAQTALRERVLLPLAIPDHVHGFVPGRGSGTNAACHQDSGLLVNIDLKDFFPGISAGRVYHFWRWVFREAAGEDNRRKLAWLATNLTTFEEHLCQGFVTSPDIANHVAWKLDQRLAGLAKAKGLRFTRYADDLTFSAKAYSGNCRWLLDAVRDICAEEGFQVHPDKIAVMRPARRQVVTGLVVNRDSATGAVLAPRVPRHELRRIRAMCDKGAEMARPEDRGHVEGWISYIHSVSPDKAAQLRALLNTRLASGRRPSTTTTTTKDKVTACP